MSTKYAVQPTPMRLFSSSLEAHMAAYTEEIKLNQLNQEYQLAQNRIIREGELYNLSQADLMNRLNTLKEQLLNSIKVTTIPLSKTNAPEMKAKEEKFIPMTASEYENKINSKKNKQPTFAEELLKNQGKDKKGIKITLPDILDKKSNLKKATPNAPKTKSKSPFQKELEAKINIRNKDINKKEKIMTFNKKLEPLDINAPFIVDYPKSTKENKPVKTIYKKTGKVKTESALEGLLTEEGKRKLKTGPKPSDATYNKRTGTYIKNKKPLLLM